MKVTLKQIKEVLSQPISKFFEKGTNCTKERVYEIIRKNKGEPPQKSIMEIFIARTVVNTYMHGISIVYVVDKELIGEKLSKGV